MCESAKLPAEKIGRVVRVRADDRVRVAVGEAVAVAQLERGGVDADLGARDGDVHGHPALLAEESVVLDEWRQMRESAVVPRCGRLQ